jgi:hypothetical protein
LTEGVAIPPKPGHGGKKATSDTFADALADSVGQYVVDTEEAAA